MFTATTDGIDSIMVIDSTANTMTVFEVPEALRPNLATVGGASSLVAVAIGLMTGQKVESLFYEVGPFGLPLFSAA